MQWQTILGPGLMLAVLGVATTGCVHAAENGSEQKIYLDPETGDVIDQPNGADTTGGTSAQRAGEQSGDKHSPYTAWKTRDGTQMLSVKPGHASAERVVRCADGTLRMGHADPNASGDDENALCNTTRP